MAWKQRLYAFLLRRVLGPYLSTESLQQLHESMNVSLNDGRLVLGNIRLNASYLTEKMQKQSNDDNNSSQRPLRIVQARVRRLEINLSLQESSSSSFAGQERHAYNDNDESSSTTTTTTYATSVAWRAMQLGREGGVCLMASVLIEGIELDVCPGSFAKPKEEEEQPPKDASETTSNAAKTTTTTLSPPSSASSMISSYVDAALASLKLCLSLKDVRVRLVVAPATAAATAGSPKSFLQLHLSSATYRDAANVHNNNQNNNDDDDSDRVSSSMQKILDFGGITLETGELHYPNEEEEEQQQQQKDNNDVQEMTTKHKILMAKVDGSGQLSWLVSSSSLPSADKDDESATKISQDIELRIHPQVQVSVTHESIRHCLLVARAFGRTEATEDEENNDEDDDAEPTAAPLGSLVTEINQEADYDEQDVQTVQGIMEQYLEARELAEKNQVRGGILIPSDDDDGQDHHHQVSFDAFFDANEQSFAMYKSVLEESLMHSPNDHDDDDNHDDDKDHHDGNKDGIQSQFKLHLGECGIKVSFLPPTDGPSHVQTDYVLCLFGDLNVVASTASSGSAHVNASLGHWEVEASHVLRRGCRPEIVTLLRFDADDDMMSNNVVALAPCVDLQVTLPQRRRQQQRRRAKEGSQNETKLDLRLQPIHLLCHPLSLAATNKLVSSVKNNIAALSTSNPRSGEDVVKSVATKDETNNKLSFSVWTPSLEVLVPVETNPDYNVLFRRSGYVSSSLTPSPDSYIGLSMEDVVLSTLTEEDGEKAACQRAIVFVTAPQLSKSLQVVAMKRVDVVALSGLQPIALVHKRLSVERSAFEPPPVSLGASSCTVASTATFFPRVPAVSSFKARQDDDDFQDEFSEQVVSALRIHDPQVGMVRKAERSTVLIDLHVPDISLDLTKQELITFGRVLTSVSSSSSSQTKTPTAATAKKPTRNKPSQGTKALSVRFDQLTFCIHEDPVEGVDKKDSAASFKLIGSRWEACAVVEDSSPQCARFLCHGFDVYFARHLLRTNETNGAYTSIQDRCNAIRHRTVRDQNTSALPVFYRSQLFSPLSPESPALQLDAVNMSVDGETEWNIFFTMYNLTHRFDIDSTWVESLSKLCKTEREGSALKSETPETKSSIFKVSQA